MVSPLVSTPAISELGLRHGVRVGVTVGNDERGAGQKQKNGSSVQRK